MPATFPLYYFKNLSGGVRSNPATTRQILHNRDANNYTNI